MCMCVCMCMCTHVYVMCVSACSHTCSTYCMYHLMCCDCLLPQDKGDYAGALSLTGEVLMVCGTSITPQTMQVRTYVRMFVCVVSVQLSIES